MFHVTAEHEITRAEIIKVVRESRAVFYTPHQSLLSSDLAHVDRHVSPRETQIEEEILASLGFPYMNDRYYEIEDAHERTFEWIYQPTDPEASRWDDFSDWLAHGKGIYWINGKAGSGKSTLMRYIYDDNRTSSLLKQWAGTSNGLLTAGFFFWKSGVPEQASQMGLLRSLLHTLLSQNRELIPKVLPEDWLEFQVRPFEPLSKYFGRRWYQKELENVLRVLFQLLVGTRVCLFIDGLDEYNGDPADTIKLLKGISSTDIKICVSSRPWNEFHQAFDGFPGLRLQDLTFNDIRLYVKETLAGDERMDSLSYENPIQASNLVTEIVNKADGVFLWVKFVVRSLLEGITNGDTISQLQSRLEELPSDLVKLYSYMLGAVKPRYRVEGSKYFQMSRAWQDLDILPAFGLITVQPIRALVLSLALEESHTPLDDSNFTLIDFGERKSLIGKLDKRLKVCCAGLLEVSDDDPEASDAPHRYPQQHGEITADNPQVKYIHRTAFDFLSEDQTYGGILAATSSIKFGAHSALLRGYISLLKSCSTKIGIGPWQLKGLISTPMSLAYSAEKEAVPPTIEFLDETLSELSRHSPLTGQGIGKSQTIFSSSEWFWPQDTLVWAIRCSLFRYVSVKLGLPCQIPRSPCGRSYLCYALGVEGESGKTIIGSERTIAFLLPYSSKSDVEEGWKRALCCVGRHARKVRRQRLSSLHPDRQARDDMTEMWLVVLKLFLEYGADPAATIPGWKEDDRSEVLFEGESYKSRDDSDWSVKKIVGVLGRSHPIEAAKVQTLIAQSKTWWPQLGLFKHYASMELPNLEWQQYPERTWWKVRIWYC
jgi:hypothetical protein